MTDDSPNTSTTSCYFLPPLPEHDDDEDDDRIVILERPPSDKRRITFSRNPIPVYATYSVEEYDRRNEDVDPVSASAEWELEKVRN